MAKTLMVIGDPVSNIQNFATTNYRPISGNCSLDTLESSSKLPISVAGTFSGMTANYTVNSVDGITTVRFRNNAANGSQTFTIAASTTGQFQDTINSDTVASGDLVNYSIVTGGTVGTQAPQIMTSTFDTTTPATLSVTRLAILDVGGISGFTGASTTYFKALTGWFETTKTVTEVNVQAKVQYSGTYKNLACRILTNSRTTTTTVKSRKNTANGAMSVAYGSTATGLVQDTTNSDTVVSGDLMCYAIVNGTGTLAITHCSISCEFHTAVNPGIGQILCINPTLGTNARALTIYQQIGGSLNPKSVQTEAVNQVTAGENWTFKGLQVKVKQNSITPESSTITLRNNGVDTALVASATAATTGWFQDTTNSVTIATGDLVNYKIVSGTGSGTQTITLTAIGMYTEMSGSTSITMTPNLLSLTNKFITKI